MNNIEEVQQFSLKELRARKKKTQKQVAQELGVSVQTYCEWEKSVANVAVGKVQAIANYYGVRLSQIFLG